MNAPFSKAFYERAYTILVELGGASPSMKDSFVHYATEEVGDHFEWRFQGHFGFGGKIWRRVADYKDGVTTFKHDVAYYPEDHTKKLDTLKNKINKRIVALEKEYA